MGDKTAFLWATSHNPARLALGGLSVAMLLFGLCGAAAAQGPGWQWLDATGRKVYSDLPPPSSVPDKNILQRPSSPAMSRALPASPPGPVEAPPPAGSKAAGGAPGATPAKPGKEPSLSDAELRSVVEKRNAEIRQENCQRARDALASLVTGTRLLTANAKGEPVVMDDEMRAAETRRMQKAEQENCSPVTGAQ